MAATSTKQTARRAARGPLKGRAWVAMGLVAFLMVAAMVVWRRSVGVAAARDMRRLSEVQRGLLSEKTTLERDIRAAMARRRVIAEAERRLGLHVASDAQTRILSDSLLAIPARPDAAVPDSALRP
jgi:hypothetical protein